MDKSIQLAKLWVTLDQIKGQLDNTAIPLGSHLSIEDPELMATDERQLEGSSAILVQANRIKLFVYNDLVKINGVNSNSHFGN